MSPEKSIPKIRRATTADATAIAALLYKAFVEYKSLYTDEGFDATTPRPKDMELRIAMKAVWIVVEGEKIVGTVSLFPRYGELFVRSMAVSPEARGKGIGKLLMNHAHEIAFSSGCVSITLNTTPFLLPAIKLYERFGFVAEGPADLFGTALIKMNKSLVAVNETTRKLVDY